MIAITYLDGDATQPQVSGNKIIAHVCNDIGGWGRGFVLAISKKWAAPESEYRNWHRNRSSNDFALGAVQFVNVEHDLWIANMVGQHGIKAGDDGSPPIRYDSIDKCLATLSETARTMSASVHMPRIGCGLAGGEWERIEPLLSTNLCQADVAVYVYDFGE